LVGFTYASNETRLDRHATSGEAVADNLQVTQALHAIERRNTVQRARERAARKRGQ
jgi:hypothetical protein